MQFRHVMKVHSIYAGNKGQGDKNRGDDRECLHDLIHADGELGKVEVV
jgi:hypothetical protein